MNKTIKISSFQIIAIMTNFLLEFGFLHSLAKEANQDAWIVVLLLTICGVILFLLNCFLFFRNGSKTFIGVINYSFGKYLGRIISYVYICYFVFIAAIIVTDFSFLMSSTLLFNKDLWLLSLSFILILLYACYLGMEAFARTAEILFFVFIGFLLLSIFFVFSNSQVDVNNALPVGTDWNKIVKNINARNITIPFGEIIACGALFSYVKESKNFHLKGIITVLLIGCFSSLISFIIIGMLGPQLLKESSYPFIAALAKIYILDIIQRFDIIGVIIFMIGALIKAGVYLLVAKNSIVNLHPKISIAPLLLCFGIIVLSITIYLTKESTFFYFIRFHIVPYYLHLPLQIFIPILIAIILILRKALSVQNKKYTKNEL